MGSILSAVTEVRRQEENQSGFPPKGPQEGGITVISHRKDADGITSAALIQHLTGGSVILADYAEMVNTLAEVPISKELFVCDLGTNKTTFPGFLKELERLSQRGTVHYIDHHPLDPELEKKIKAIGVDLYHSTEESCAVLVYRKFQSPLSLDPKMKVLACCGAITDYMDLQPYAKRLIASFDRQFLLYEATVLSFSIAMISRDGIGGNPQLVKMVQELARSKLPHEIDNASNYAQEFASSSAALIERARREGKKMEHFAYFKTRERSTGNVANFLIGALDVQVGVAFREDGSEHYEISLRSIQESDKDLGKIVGKISNKLDASGGGHVHAAGARIRKDQFDEFVSLLDQELA